MATVVGLSRCTWEHSTFKLPSLHMSLTINTKDDLGENLLPCTLIQRTSACKTCAVGWEHSALSFSGYMWRHKAVLVENLRSLLMYI